MLSSLLPTYQPDRLDRLRQLPAHGEGFMQRRILHATRNGRYVWAELLCRLQLLVQPRDPAVAARLGLFLWARGRTGAAERYLARYLSQFPGQDTIRWLLSVIAEGQKHVEEALAILGEARPLTEPDIILSLRIRLHRSRGQTEEVVALANVARTRFPNTAWPCAVLTRALLDHSQVSQAQEIAQEARQKYPDNPVFPLLLARIAKNAGDFSEALRQEFSCLELCPDHHVGMRMLLQSLSMDREAVSVARPHLAAYKRAATAAPADYGLVRQIAGLDNAAPDIIAIRQIAYGQGSGGDTAFDNLLARAALGDFAGVAQRLSDILRSGGWDQRLIAFLRVYGQQAAPYFEEYTVPELEFLDSKLRVTSISQHLAQVEEGNMAALGRFLPESLDVDMDQPLVSFLCPIHRRRDIGNILAQVGGQLWRSAEVIFCVSNPDIDEQELALAQAGGHVHCVLRHAPGNTVGYYLNRCIEKASGEYLLRFDADDFYAPEYTHYMVALMQGTKADVLSMDLSSYYFVDINQTYHIRTPLPVSTDGTVENVAERVGSGSSMCAARHVFDTLKFSETQTAGEDISFYRTASAMGMHVRMVPGYFHTAARHSDGRSHTWQMDDFNLLTRQARLLGEGCVTPKPGVVGDDIGVRDIYTGLFTDARLEWMQELHLEEVMRTYPRPLCLVVGENTPVVEQRGKMLDVIREPAHSGREGRHTWVFIPEDPSREDKLARRLGGHSVIRHIIPELVAGKRDVFRQMDGFKPESSRVRARRFRRARNRYIILCNPRSGSEYLAGMLASMGMGVPAELLRQPVVTLLAAGCSLDEYLPGILCEGVRDNVLGTKLVSQYLFEHLSDVQQSALLQWIAREGFHIVRLRRAEAASAVSDYIANRRGVWHKLQRPAAKNHASQALAGVEFPPYDFEAIAGFMRNHQAWSRRLDALLDASIPADKMLDLDYRDIVSSPARSVQKIARQVGFEPLPGIVPVSITRAEHHEMSIQEDYRVRFVADWEASAKQLE